MELYDAARDYMLIFGDNSLYWVLLAAAILIFALRFGSTLEPKSDDDDSDDEQFWP